MKTIRKNGSALATALIFLSILLLIALSVTLSLTGELRSGINTRKSEQTFQDADAIADAFDKVFEDTSFLKSINEVFGGTTAFGTCNLSDGLIYSSNFTIEIFTGTIANKVHENCYASGATARVGDIKKVIIKVFSENGTARAIENVPPCADFDPNAERLIEGHWPLSANYNDTSRDENLNLYNNHATHDEAGGSAAPVFELIGPTGKKRNALHLNKDNAINNNNITDLTINRAFNLVKIAPQDQYEKKIGTISFWFYSENEDSETFAPVSKDIGMCVNDDALVSRTGAPSQTWCTNNPSDLDCIAVYNTCSFAHGLHYHPINSVSKCDCGHLSFIWNANLLGLNNVFGTRFQNDGNGFYYPLFAKTNAIDTDGDGVPDSGTIKGEWHFAAITYDGGYPKLYFDENEVSNQEIMKKYAGPQGADTGQKDYYFTDPEGVSASESDFPGLVGNNQYIYLGLFAGRIQRLYNNGNAIDEIKDCISRNWTSASGGPTSSGCSADGKIIYNLFKGGIRDLRIYNTPLTECQIRRLYLATD